MSWCSRSRGTLNSTGSTSSVSRRGTQSGSPRFARLAVELGRLGYKIATFQSDADDEGRVVVIVAVREAPDAEDDRRMPSGQVRPGGSHGWLPDCQLGNWTGSGCSTAPGLFA